MKIEFIFPDWDSGVLPIYERDINRTSSENWTRTMRYTSTGWKPVVLSFYTMEAYSKMRQPFRLVLPRLYPPLAARVSVFFSWKIGAPAGSRYLFASLTYLYSFHYQVLSCLKSGLCLYLFQDIYRLVSTRSIFSYGFARRWDFKPFTEFGRIHTNVSICALLFLFKAGASPKSFGGINYFCWNWRSYLGSN